MNDSSSGLVVRMAHCMGNCILSLQELNHHRQIRRAAGHTDKVSSPWRQFSSHQIVDYPGRATEDSVFCSDSELLDVVQA